MKILLIGNKGQIGREIEELSLEKHLPLIGFDIDNLDITNPERIDEIFCKIAADTDIVINAAAYTAVDKAEDEPEMAYAVNCEGVRNLAKVCSNNGLPLLHISTDYVFAGNQKSPYSENDITGPLGVYGKSKLAGEQALTEVWEKYIILRVSWVFGKHGHNFVKTILRLAEEREELNIVGDQYGCPTPATDIARILLELVEKIGNGKCIWGIYNYCGFPATTWFEFAKKIISVAKGKFAINVQTLNSISTNEYPTKAVRPHNSELLVKKIINDYGIERHIWENYLRKVIGEIVV